MNEEREEIFYGVWFLPESQVRAQGRLTVSDNFIDLHLTDPSIDNLTTDRDQEEFPIIYGIGSHNESFTLYDCDGFIGSYHAKILLYGNKHYGAIEDLKFALVSANLPFFDQWINPRSFKKETSKAGFTISYENPENIDFDINESLKLNIDFTCYIPQTENKTSVHLNQYSSIQILSKTKEGWYFKDYLLYLKYIQQFISFIYRDGANFSVIRVYDTPEEFSRNRYMGIMVYTLNDFNHNAILNNSNHSLISYRDVTDIFVTTITNWLDFAKGAQHILSLILQDYFYRGAFDENRFLNLVRALEIFHAFKDPSTKLPLADFEAKLAEIISYLPEKYKNEVCGDLKFTNRLTLDMRLKSLISEVPNNQLGLDTVLDKAFIKNLKNSRNYYTHYDPQLKSRALIGEPLMKLTESCRTLLNYLILRHLQIPEDRLVDPFKYYIERYYYSNYV